jgi:hypothetical protein
MTTDSLVDSQPEPDSAPVVQIKKRTIAGTPQRRRKRGIRSVRAG